MISREAPVRVDFVTGDATGLTIPAHEDALRSVGARFLTEAFHRFGYLSGDDRVIRIVRATALSGGNSGHKLGLAVEYASRRPALHTQLFVKFSRDFSDAFRDRRRYELEAEVHFAALSRLPHFPIEVPVACFADFNRASGTGLLITQLIPFGVGNIEPLRLKCRDHELADPLAHYRAIVTTLARLAGAHRSGRLSPEVDTHFTFTPAVAEAEDPIPWTEPQLRDLVAHYAAFAARCPQLLPPNLTTPGFISRLELDAIRFLHHERTIKRFLNADPAFIALCHYNANIDNAWFWRDGAGVLQCGLLDWGRVRQMNVANALWGALCAADLDIWDRHLDELLHLFVTQLHLHGGPLLKVEELELRLHCYVAMVGLNMLMQAPALVMSRLPEAANATSLLAPVFDRNEVARGFLHVFITFLNLWESRNVGSTLDRVLEASSGGRTVQ
jgi:hypothetical protein